MGRPGWVSVLTGVYWGLHYTKFKRRECQWLLVPISLGSRLFMAFDDIVVAELTNRFRFSMYYDAFGC